MLQMKCWGETYITRVVGAGGRGVYVCQQVQNAAPVSTGHGLLHPWLQVLPVRHGIAMATMCQTVLQPDCTERSQLRRTSGIGCMLPAMRCNMPSAAATNAGITPTRRVSDTSTLCCRTLTPTRRPHAKAKCPHMLHMH
jgi:hypothetical protein